MFMQKANERFWVVTKKYEDYLKTTAETSSSAVAEKVY